MMMMIRLEAEHRTSWALIGPDTNFREGLRNWGLLWHRNFNTRWQKSEISPDRSPEPKISWVVYIKMAEITKNIMTDRAPLWNYLKE